MTIENIVEYVLKTPRNTNRAILTAMLEELAGGSIIDGVVQLRRDNDYNYAKVGDTFIPANGEVCLVDTARNGLRVKCGDGVSTWNQLDFADEYVVKGYYHEEKFYRDEAHTIPVEGADQRIYVDIKERVLYFFDNNKFITVAGNCEFDGTTEKTTATEDTPGTMKLYQNIGLNEDGTMSQKAIVNELEEKLEAVLDADEELLILDPNL
jgi:hypothetical protein